MKILILSLALLAPSAVLAAQAPSPDTAAQAPPAVKQHHADPHKAAARLASSLGLTADQQARLEPILAARMQQVNAARANTQLTDGDRRQQIKVANREAHTQMGSVLTPDQMRQLKAMHHAQHITTPGPTGV